MMKMKQSSNSKKRYNKGQLLLLLLLLQVVFLGDSGVGKTSLIHRLSCDKFTSHQSTLGLDFDTCTVPVGDERVVFQLWDTAGQERFIFVVVIVVVIVVVVIVVIIIRFQSTTAVYFRRADAFIVVYDVTNKYSFKNIKSWISLVKVIIIIIIIIVIVIIIINNRLHYGLIYQY